MTPDKAELLHNLRREIASRQRILDRMNEGELQLTDGRGQDVGAAFADLTRREIERLQAVVERYDPDGFTVLSR